MLTNQRPEVLSLKNAFVGYPGHVLFQVREISLARGQWTTLLGPNGCGKSTLLKTMAGVLPPISGERVARISHCGYVPQRFSPSRDSLVNVREFLAMQPFLRESLRAPSSRELLERIGVDTLLKQPLRNLSGGQIQKVLFAFALLGEPELILLDEFLEGIDAASRPRLKELLDHYRRQRNAAILEVSHDVTSVAETADRVIIIDHGILFDGSPRDHGFHQCLHEVYGELVNFQAHRGHSGLEN